MKVISVQGENGFDGEKVSDLLHDYIRELEAYIGNPRKSKVTEIYPNLVSGIVTQNDGVPFDSDWTLAESSDSERMAKKLSNANKAILYAYNRGYKACKDGGIIGVSGLRLKLAVVQGYYYFNVRPPFIGRSTIIKAGRYIAYCKYGDAIFNDGILVRHLNGDKSDDSFDNIAIGTQSDNMMDIPADKRLRKSVMAGRSGSKLNVDNVRSIRGMYEDGRSYTEIARFYDIEPGTVASICQGKTWTKYMD